jgi:hypothetical protein
MSGMMMTPIISSSPAPAGHGPAPKAGFVFLGSAHPHLADSQITRRQVDMTPEPRFKSMMQGHKLT